MRIKPTYILLVAALSTAAASTTVAITRHQARAAAIDENSIFETLYYNAGTIQDVCGVERWDVKTLSDPAASQVNYTPVTKTVSYMRGLPKPAVGTSTPRMTGPEMTTYQITANLIEAKQESDRDFHVVIADLKSSTKTMIVEFDDPTCPGASSSAKVNEMKTARDAFIAACGTPGSSGFTKLKGKATFQGVGFFDILHGQTGVAPNGVELHALLSFSTTGCTRP